MMNEVNEIDWNEIIEKFSSYDGSIQDFCRENNISHHQLYYRRKKLREEKEKTAFHAIKLNTKDTVNSNDSKGNSIKAFKDIRIEIGKANVYIPVTEIDLVSKLLKELVQ